MEAYIEERSPATCHSLGLDCYSCVARSAESVASVCRGVPGHGLSKIFAQLYPSAGCAPMAPAFEDAYFGASPLRKPVVRAVAAA